MFLKEPVVRPDAATARLDKQAVITTNWRGFLTVRPRLCMAGCK
tara:strand:- start:1135 stop:1266 length:132 start_codon:yes stop_codon:yes gene_type:complete